MSNEYKDWQSDEIHDLHQQLTTVTRERDYWKGVAESECDARKEMSDRLDQCERDRDDRLADAKHYFEWLGEVQKKFEAVTKERDELRLAREENEKLRMALDQAAHRFLDLGEISLANEVNAALAKLAEKEE